MLKNLIKNIKSGEVSSWSKEILSLTNPGDRVLEIGCGSGMSTLYLAKNERLAVGLDYSDEALNLLKKAAKALQLEVKAVYADATENLPFEVGSFDMIFQAGLLEHFDKVERTAMLKMWKPYAKRMVSMIPNAHSIAYRVGKAMQEAEGTWQYGLEMPQATLWQEFNEAGFRNIKEYSVDAKSAFTFLPQSHYLRKALENVLDEGLFKDDLLGQGYLLVTIGDNGDF